MFDPVTIALSLGKLLFGYAEKKSSERVEIARIDAGVDEKELEAQVKMGQTAASVVKSGMQFKVFWIPWLIAAVPLAMWFGWGMLDSLSNGGLPDVAALPPQLEKYADVVWSNIFYSGGIMGGATVIAGALRKR